jgi:hypothetical protein
VKLVQAERRLSQRLVQYWNSLKEYHHTAPQEQDVLPDMIADIWPNCFIIKRGVQGNPQGFRYSFLGKAISHECIQAPPHTRRFLERVLQLHNSAALEAEKSIETEAPVFENNDYLDGETSQRFRYRRCFVPLRDEENEIGLVLGGLRWKVYNEKPD